MAGLWFDELKVGQHFDHAIRRTVTETDNVLISTLTHNPAQLHLDADYMKGTEYGRVIVNSTFTLGLMVGVSVGDTTLGTAIANLGWDEVRFPVPVFIGDTVTVTHEHLVQEYEEPPRRFQAGEALTQQRQFQVPRQGMHSFSANRNKLEWFIRARVEMNGWPDFIEEYPLSVQPRLA